MIKFLDTDGKHMLPYKQQVVNKCLQKEDGYERECKG